MPEHFLEAWTLQDKLILLRDWRVPSPWLWGTKGHQQSQVAPKPPCGIPQCHPASGKALFLEGSPLWVTKGASTRPERLPGRHTNRKDFPLMQVLHNPP